MRAGVIPTRSSSREDNEPLLRLFLDYRKSFQGHVSCTRDYRYFCRHDFCEALRTTGHDPQRPRRLLDRDAERQGSCQSVLFSRSSISPLYHPTTAYSRA
jgi:hypothetical protein